MYPKNVIFFPFTAISDNLLLSHQSSLFIPLPKRCIEFPSLSIAAIRNAPGNAYDVFLLYKFIKAPASNVSPEYKSNLSLFVFNFIDESAILIFCILHSPAEI